MSTPSPNPTPTQRLPLLMGLIRSLLPRTFCNLQLLQHPKEATFMTLTPIHIIPQHPMIPFRSSSLPVHPSIHIHQLLRQAVMVSVDMLICLLQPLIRITYPTAQTISIPSSPDPAIVQPSPHPLGSLPPTMHNHTIAAVKASLIIVACSLTLSSATLLHLLPRMQSSLLRLHHQHIPRRPATLIFIAHPHYHGRPID